MLLLKTWKTKNFEKCFSKFVFDKISSETRYSGSRAVPKKFEVASYRKNTKLGLFFKNGLKWMKVFFFPNFSAFI